MEVEDSKIFKQLLLDEIGFRKEFREAREKIESLVDPITEHNARCCKFWDKHLPKIEEVIIMMDNGTTLKCLKPKLEKASVETYLPYGIEFSECDVINFF